MDKTFLRGSERFSELLARGDVAPCPDHLESDCPLRPALQATRAVPGTTPRVMEGFTITPFVTGLEHPRRLLVLPNNDVIVAEQRTGYLTLLRDEDRDGKADFIQRYADDFKAPYGLAYRDGFVLVADQEGIWRVPHVSGAVRAGRPDNPKVSEVPPDQRKPVPAAYGQELITQRGVFGVIAGHQNRHLALEPRTGAMFVGVGSAGNIGVEPEVKASIQRFEPVVPENSIRRGFAR